jgi:IPT/TIG domain
VGSEVGDTLIEVLLALVVIGLTAAAILGALATTLLASSTHRTLASSDSVLRSFVEYATYDIRLSTTPQFVPEDSACSVTGSSYSGVVTSSGFNNPGGTAYVNHLTVTMSPTVTPVHGSSGTCNAATPELLTASVSPIRTVSDGVTNATTTVTSATAAFVSSDVGSVITGTNIPVNTTVVAVNSSTNVTLSQAATGSGSGGTLNIIGSKTRTVTDAVTNATTVVTSATAGFVSSDVGSVITGTNIPVNTTVVAVNSSTNVTLSQAATGSGSGGTLTIISPSDSVQFVVSQPDQAEASVNPAAYTISPTSAPAAGGGTITVTAKSGTPFTGATWVNFGPNQAAATVGGGGASVTATIPVETSSLFQPFISVTTPTGTTFPASVDQFTYGPTVTNVAPNTGPPAGGVSVSVSGSGFTATSTVKFGTASATVAAFNGSTSLTVTEPAGSVGAVDVRVTNPALAANGISPTSTADQFTYGLSVTSVSPSTGTAAGGTMVTISGSGFTGATGVTFEGVPATSFAFVNDGQVTAVSPPGSGTVDVQVKTAAGQSPVGNGDKFVYTGGSSTPVGLGILLAGASNPTPTLHCTWSNTGMNNCSVKGVGCGGSATFYIETVDGSGNPVAVTSPLGILVANASPSGVTILSGSFTTYASNQPVVAQLSSGGNPPCNNGNPRSETVTLAASINGTAVSLPILVSSS